MLLGALCWSGAWGTVEQRGDTFPICLIPGMLWAAASAGVRALEGTSTLMQVSALWLIPHPVPHFSFSASKPFSLWFYLPSSWDSLLQGNRLQRACLSSFSKGPGICFYIYMCVWMYIYIYKPLSKYIGCWLLTGCSLAQRYPVIFFLLNACKMS